MKLIIWVNSHGSELGGCERYIASTVTALKKDGVTSYFFYDSSHPTDSQFLGLFDAAYPLIDPARQIGPLEADFIYVHQWEDSSMLYRLAHLGIPAIRFLHDHKLLCLREHKITGIGKSACLKPSGFRCYPCLGFIRARPTLKLRSLRSLRNSQKVLLEYHRVVVASDYMAAELKREGIPLPKIVVHPLYAEETSSPLYKKEPDLLLYSGRLSREKGLSSILYDLATITLPFRLVIAGDGPELETLKRRCSELAIDAVFLGKLGQEELRKWLEKATCLLFPCGRPEPFGLAGIEAMRSSTPVIGSDLGAVREWLDHGKSGFLVSHGSSWRPYVEKLLSDFSLVRDMGKRGHQLYEAKFRPKTHIEGLCRLSEREANARYAPKASLKGQSFLSEIVYAVQSMISSIFPEGFLQTFLLTGSYGKQEGGIELVDGVERPHNDLDFLLVTRGLSGRERKVWKEKLDEALDPLRERFKIGVVLSLVSRRRLEWSQGCIAWYEMVNGHQTLLGDDSFLHRLSLRSVGTIPSLDVLRMAINRGSLLVINRQLLEEPERFRRIIIKHIHKAIIGFGDALLFSRGGYHYSYLERARRIPLLVPEISTQYQEAIVFRLAPDYSKYESEDLDEWMNNIEDLLSTLYSEVRLLETRSPIWKHRFPLIDLFPSVAFGRPSPIERSEYLSLWGGVGDENFHKMMERARLGV